MDLTCSSGITFSSIDCNRIGEAVRLRRSVRFRFGDTSVDSFEDSIELDRVRRSVCGELEPDRLDKERLTGEDDTERCRRNVCGDPDPNCFVLVSIVSCSDGVDNLFRNDFRSTSDLLVSSVSFICSNVFHSSFRCSDGVISSLTSGFRLNGEADVERRDSNVRLRVGDDDDIDCKWSKCQ